MNIEDAGDIAWNPQTGFAYVIDDGNYLNEFGFHSDASQPNFIGVADHVGRSEGAVTVDERTGHLLVLGGEELIVEATRENELIRVITLEYPDPVRKMLDGEPSALAYDSQRRLLYGLDRGNRVSVFQLSAVPEPATCSALWPLLGLIAAFRMLERQCRTIVPIVDSEKQLSQYF